MTNMNPTKTKRRPQNTSKTPQTRTASEQKTTETKKFPRKPPKTHLIFSKTQNQLPFIFTTNEKTTKDNRDHKTHKKHPKQEQDQTQKRKKKTKAIDTPQKVPLNLPDVLQNPQFTLLTMATNRNPTKTQWRTQNTSKTPQTRTGSNPKTKEKPQKP